METNRCWNLFNIGRGNNFHNDCFYLGLVSYSFLLYVIFWKKLFDIRLVGTYWVKKSVTSEVINWFQIVGFTYTSASKCYITVCGLFFRSIHDWHLSLDSDQREECPWLEPRTFGAAVAYSTDCAIDAWESLFFLKKLLILRLRKCWETQPRLCLIIVVQNCSNLRSRFILGCYIVAVTTVKTTETRFWLHYLLRHY